MKIEILKTVCDNRFSHLGMQSIQNPGIIDVKDNELARDLLEEGFAKRVNEGPSKEEKVKKAAAKAKRETANAKKAAPSYIGLDKPSSSR